MDNVVIVGEAVAGESAKARETRKRLMYLAATVDENTFDLAVALVDAKVGKMYLLWGYSSILEYGMKELGLKKRKIQYLTRIVTVCRELGIERSDYEKAGVTKLRSITVLDPEASYFNKETKENESMANHMIRLILNADEMTGKEMDAEISKLMGLEGENEIITRSHKWSKSTYENVITAAVERVRLILGTKKRDSDGNAVEYTESECLEMICADYNADPNNAEPDVPVEELAPQSIKVLTEEDI